MAQDVYTRLNDLDEATVRGIADVLEIRGRHPQQIAIRAAYLDALGDISGQHVLALTNRGDGTTADLLALATEVRDGVRARFGIDLHPEPVLVGCSF